MTFRKLIMLGGIGGFMYAHHKRGGQWNLEGFKETGRDLLGTVKSRAAELRSQAEDRIQDVVGQVKDTVQANKTSDVDQGGSFAEDVTGYGSSGYGYSNRR